VRTDRVVYCFKVDWKFGLFFDFRGHLDINNMELDLGKLHRYLSFQHIYKTLEAEDKFEEIVHDGWFPFIEIIGMEYKMLTECYQNKFDFENRVAKFLDRFDGDRIEKMKNKWWSKTIFAEKKLVIEAGVDAYLSRDNINCIKNLLSEVEGIVRLLYFRDRGTEPKTPDLIQYIVEKGKTRSGSDYSLLLPGPFLQYLNNAVFAKFDLNSGNIPLSRHSSGHGVANASDYTKARALQAILTLDQLFFYL
jgi:hypothetical protein